MTKYTWQSDLTVEYFIFHANILNKGYKRDTFSPSICWPCRCEHVSVHIQCHRTASVAEDSWASIILQYEHGQLRTRTWIVLYAVPFFSYYNRGKERSWGPDGKKKSSFVWCPRCPKNFMTIGQGWRLQYISHFFKAYTMNTVETNSGTLACSVWLSLEATVN